MRNHNLTGIIIHKRNFMEADLILTVLTEEGTKIELLAKGASGRSRRKSHLELMNQIEGTFYEGKTHAYLQSVQCKTSFNNLKKDLQLILQMHIVLEIINKTVPENDPQPEVYKLLNETLTSLNQIDPHELTTEITLIKLANLLGLLPNFKECSSCHKFLTEDEAQWDKEHSTVFCSSCFENADISDLANNYQHIPLKYRKAVEFFRVASQEQYKKVTLKPEEKHELKTLVPHLFTKHLGAPLKSLAIL